MTSGIARRAARHPWLVLGAWIAGVLAAAFAVVALLGSGLTSDDDFTNNPESKRGEALLERGFGGSGDFDADGAIIVRANGLTVDDPAYRQRVSELASRLDSLDGGSVIYRQTSYHRDRDPSLVSPDRDSTLVLFDLADDNVAAVRELVAAENGERGFELLLTGTDAFELDIEETAEKDLQRAEIYGLGLAFLILLVVFGALVASVVPLLVAALSIVVALGLTALVGQAFTLDFFVVNMLVMMGLAVGIDYSLFIVSRYREERGRGREKLDAIGLAGATATRAVVFSGFAVVIALVGMLLVPQTIFRSLATGAILVVVVSVAAALTLLPALLGLLGDRVDALRLPFRRARAGNGFWGRVADGVMRRPRLSLAAGTAVLVALAVPYVGINTGTAGVSALPASFESRQAFDVVQEEFGPTRTSIAEVAVSGDMGSPAVARAIGQLRASLANDGRFGATDLAVNESGDIGLLSVAVAGDPIGEDAIGAVRDLRDEYIPAAFDDISADVLVTGETAGELDFHDLAAHYQPIVFAVVLGLSFVLLVLAFRSLVVPATAIATNLLSVAAAYGLLVLVFQHGVGADLLGLQQVDTVEAWLPLFLFSVLFGLSMDYQVFLLSRIRERYLETGDNAEAVAFGVRSTSRLITGAALIMVAVFAGFASGDLIMMQQLGFGLGAAVLLDATLVRSVLVPAAMQLLGRWNWWLPRPLQRLPQLRAEPATE
jgi:putative drug exporter of the RND superfamily